MKRTVLARDNKRKVTVVNKRTDEGKLICAQVLLRTFCAELTRTSLPVCRGVGHSRARTHAHCLTSDSVSSSAMP